MAQVWQAPDPGSRNVWRPGRPGTLPSFHDSGNRVGVHTLQRVRGQQLVFLHLKLTGIVVVLALLFTPCLPGKEGPSFQVRFTPWHVTISPARCSNQA